MSYRIRAAERRDLMTLADIAKSQAETRRARDARLPRSPQLIPFLSNAQTLGDVLAWRGHATFVAEQAGIVLGGINLRNAEQHDRDQFASYYPRRFTSIGLLAARSDAPAQVVPDLIRRAVEQAIRWNTPPLLIHNASTDQVMDQTLRSLGFRLYYHYALRESPPTPNPSPFERSSGQADGAEGEIIIRHATKRDLDEVVRIGIESVHYHASLERTMHVAHDEPKKMRQRFEAAINEPTQSAILVAEYQRKVVGFYSIYTQTIDEQWAPPLFAPGRYGLIAEVAVEEKLRHRGIGRKIFAAVDEWFRARNVECYWLIYLPHNPLSSRFWPLLGFEPVWEVLLRDA